MADEALRELAEWVRDCHRRYELDASEADDDRVSRKNMLAAELWKARADALESALSELARLRAERDWKPYDELNKREPFYGVVTDGVEVTAGHLCLSNPHWYLPRYYFRLPAPPVQSHEKKQG